MKNFPDKLDETYLTDLLRELPSLKSLFSELVDLASVYGVTVSISYSDFLKEIITAILSKINNK